MHKTTIDLQLDTVQTEYPRFSEQQAAKVISEINENKKYYQRLLINLVVNTLTEKNLL